MVGGLPQESRDEVMPKRKTPTDAAYRFAEARLAGYGKKPSSKEYEESILEMWLAVSDALAAAGKTGKLDAEIATWLWSILDELLSNRIPQELKLMTKAGGIKDTLAMLSAKQTAAMYKQAVASGAIVDTKPIKTLTDSFGCNRQTIYDWIKAAPKGLWKNFRPSDDLAVRLKYLRIRLKHDGKYIQQHSQSHVAVSKRSRSQL